MAGILAASKQEYPGLIATFDLRAEECPMRKGPTLESWILLGLTVPLIVLSGISPADRLTWFMEALPVMLALPVLVYVNIRRPVTPVVYRVLFLGAGMILLGAHYTYAEVPLGYWVQDLFGFERNHYDRIGHTVLGAVMAMLAREVLIRHSRLRAGGWLSFGCICFAVAVGACYEFAEWAAALVLGERDSHSFLAMQGDGWDTHWDMFLAFMGASGALLLFTRAHNRQLADRGVETRERPGHAVMIRRMTPKPWHGALLALTLIALVASGVNPKERITWLMEALPVMLVVPLLVLTFKRFPLTPLLYVLIFVHACILLLGSHYTYAEVPPGYWVRDALGLERNHYDRLGHLAQGFIPAIAAREVLVRKSPLKPGTWLFVICVSIPLAFSAFYEMIEWWAALILDQGADAFLGTQGDQWDTQWDMFLAMVGAIAAQLALGRWHTKQLKVIQPSLKEAPEAPPPISRAG